MARIKNDIVVDEKLSSKLYAYEVKRVKLLCITNKAKWKICDQVAGQKFAN